MARTKTPESPMLPQMIPYVSHLTPTKRTRTLRALNTALLLMDEQFSTHSHNWRATFIISFDLHDSSNDFGSLLQDYANTLLTHARVVKANDKPAPATFIGLRFYDASGTYVKAMIICKRGQRQGSQSWIDKNADLDLVLKILAEEFNTPYLPAGNMAVPDNDFLNSLGKLPFGQLAANVPDHLKHLILAPVESTEPLQVLPVPDKTGLTLESPAKYLGVHKAPTGVHIPQDRVQDQLVPEDGQEPSDALTDPSGRVPPPEPEPEPEENLSSPALNDVPGLDF